MTSGSSHWRIVSAGAKGFQNFPHRVMPYSEFMATSFLLLFGGYDADSEQVSSKLIVVDLRHLEWWYQPVEGGVPTGRINPTMVTIGQKLYVFGGYRRYGGEFGDPHHSYCIASLSDDGKAWSWEVRDVPYSEKIPPGTILGRATPIYNGTKILLTKWRTTNDDVGLIFFFFFLKATYKCSYLVFWLDRK